MDSPKSLNEPKNQKTGIEHSELKSLIVVEAPSHIADLNNFIKCCGGLEQIEQTFQNNRERLQFKFRPDDPNSIPLFSERKTVNDLAVKIKKKKKPDGSFEFEAEPYGIINTVFHFDNTICDFHLLPTPNDTKNEIMKSDFILNCDQDFSLENDQSHTLIKQYFYSRFTQPKQIFQAMLKEENKQLIEFDLIRRVRKSRKANNLIIRWDDSIPEPNYKELEQVLKKPSTDFKLVEEIKKKFEERAIWSRHALLCQLKCSSLAMKYILPCLAYYFENGPFRNLWVRHGYDPRKDPSSKIYQVVEVRLKTLNLSETEKKNNNEKKFHHLLDQNTSLNLSSSSNLKETPCDDQNTRIPNENSFRFMADKVSFVKKNYSYHLCDIEINQVQAIIHENDNRETEFNEKDGWLTKGAIERIRSILSETIQKSLEHRQRAIKSEIESQRPNENIETTEVSDDFVFFDLEDIYEMANQ